MSRLEVSNLTVRYGGVAALTSVSLTIEPGTLVGLIGPNGAGKTTLIDTLTGFTAPADGRIVFDGDVITGLPPHERQRRGLVRTFQSLELFDDLTVRDNLLVAAATPDWRDPMADLVRPGRPVADDSVLDDVLDSLGLASLAQRYPPELSQGHRKLVAVARAVASRPSLMLLDEPAAGLDTEASQLLGVHLRRLVDRATSLLLIDHDMGLVLGVCDVIFVLDFGRIIATGTPVEIQKDPAVVAAYLGVDATAAPAESP